MDYQTIIICLTIGYFLGLLTGLLLNKINYTTEKVISLLIFTVWIVGHIVGFVMARDMPQIFDILGAAAVGNLAGINLANLLRSLKR